MLLCLSLLWTQPSFAQEPTREYAVKAGLIFNFLSYIEWPLEALPADTDLKIGIVGENPFGNLLHDMTDRSVGNHKIRVRLLEPGSDGWEECQLLFLPRDLTDQESLLRSYANAPIVTVGESQEFCSYGGTICFYKKDQNIAFKINVEVLADTGIRISSRLLRLAEVVGESK